MDAVLLEEAKVALSKAKIHLMVRPDSAFFCTVAFSLIHEFDETIPTACTNGLRIKFNPEFFMGLDPEERVYLLLHESMHCAYMHMVRLNDRCPKKWNVATDHVINLQLNERGFKMPKCGIADMQYTGMSSEQVYNLLPHQAGFPSLGKDLEAPPPDATPADIEELEQQIQDIVVRASLQSKISEDKIGTIPGDIQVFLDKLLNPKLPWHRILQKYLQTYAKGDYSYKRPNRRFFPQFYLPSLHSTALINLTIAVDISGSVSDHDFKAFVNEVHGILKMMQPEQITLIQFDTRIHHVDTIRNIPDLLQVQFHGRGGTSITCVMDWVNENKPQLLLLFSDGGFYFRERDTTKVDTLWLIHNNPGWTAPYGKVIHYAIEAP